MKSKITKVSGPLIAVKGMQGAKLYDQVHLGTNKITGEVRRLTKDTAWILAQEKADNLKPGDPAECADAPLEMELGPGLLGGIYDGLGRPLEALYAKTGDQITPGTEIRALDPTKRWSFSPSVTVGAKVIPGDLIGTLEETAHLTHKIMVPKGILGTIAEVHSGERTIDETIAIVKTPDGTDHKLTMTQNWPIRLARPYKQKHRPEPQNQTDGGELIQGGTALLQGGNGQPVLQKLIANEGIDVIVYLATGLPGSESTALIETCKKQAEPKTVLITNPSNTETAVYRGITIASYYRDMGQNTALIIDNLPAWIGAASETAGLLGEAAYEGGPPINLSGRLAELFKPAGLVTCAGTEKRQGSLTIIGIFPSREGLTEIEKTLTHKVDALWITDKEEGECAND